MLRGWCLLLRGCLALRLLLLCGVSVLLLRLRWRLLALVRNRALLVCATALRGSAAAHDAYDAVERVRRGTY